MDTTTLLLIGAGALIVLALMVVVLRRSWGGSMDNVGRLRLDIPPPAALRSVAPLPESERAAIAALLASGNKIAAIKRVRELTGLGLKEAKDMVDAWGGSGAMPAVAASAPDPRDMAEVRALALGGNKIAAIKLYRELTSVGLKEAKDAVERLERGN